MDESVMNSENSVTETRNEAGSYRLSIKNNDKEIAHVYCYLIENDLHEAPYALVEDLAVLEVARGKGLARMLMNSIVDIAKREGCYKIIANSHEKREEARALYLSLGYRAHATEFRLDLA